MALESKTIRFFILTIFIGFLAWFLTPYLAGRTEPWDSEWYFYTFVLIIVGIGFFAPTRWWLWPIGLYFGQLAHLIYMKLAHPSSEAAVWWLLGIVVLTFSIIPLYILCAIGLGIRVLVKSLKK
ncbi:MAG: hypothetical protein AABX33_08355 [Nanoarchaeota archaeon]